MDLLRPLLVALLSLVVPALFVIVVPFLLAAWVEALVVPMGPLRYLAVPLWLAGAVAMLWSAGAFTVVGGGTPTSAAPPTTLVVHGLYRYVRNPMYLGALLVVAGTALWTGSLLVLAYWLLMFAAVHAFVVWYEEPRLRRRFGRSYDDFRERVPRWLPRRGRYD